jgi:uncharacterized delta-60 repeat protein
MMADTAARGERMRMRGAFTTSRVRALRGAGAALVLILAWAGAPAATAAARPGSLDRSFGKLGRVGMDAGSHDAYGYAVAHQGSKIVVAGTHEFRSTADLLVIRLMADGKPDRTFSGDGRMTVDVRGGYDEGGGVAVLPGGKILAVGSRRTATSSRFLAVRITADGHLDHSFGGGDGVVTTGFPGGASYGNAVTVLSDGRFVVCGYGSTTTLMARYRPGGGLDRSFGTGGRVVADYPGEIGSSCFGVTHQGNKTVVAGSATDGISMVAAIARFGPRGAPDTTFSSDGFATVAVGDIASVVSVVALPSGAVVASGSTYSAANGNDVVLIKLGAHGHPDASFGGGDGVVADDLGGSDYGTGLARQSDGKLLVSGIRDQDMFVARYLTGGARDATFATNGFQARGWGHRTGGNALVVVGDKVVVAGSVETTHYRVAVERLFT